MTAAVAVTALRGRLEPESRVLLRGVGWSGYESVLAVVGDRPVRLAYDRGDLELMSPSSDHERLKSLIGRFIEVVTEELDLPCEAAGSTTWRRADLDRGIEPDECYFIARAAAVQGRSIELGRDGPPDLAVEVDLSASRLDRPGIYAALGVGELWRFDGQSVRFELLNAAGRYEPSTVSRNVPELTSADVAHWLDLAATMGQTTWARRVRAWVRDELAGRVEGGRG